MYDFTYEGVFEWGGVQHRGQLSIQYLVLTRLVQFRSEFLVGLKFLLGSLRFVLGRDVLVVEIQCIVYYWVFVLRL